MLINNYLNKLTKEDINNFLLNNNCKLSNNELDFTYNFIKKNGMTIIKSPHLFDINKYHKYYTQNNFLIIKNLYQEYYHKYKNYL